MRSTESITQSINESKSEAKIRRGMRRASAALAGLCLLGAAPTGSEGGSEGDRPSDTWITVATKMVLVGAQAVDGHAIGADAVDGVVTLHGMVGSEAERTRATAVASRVPGVREIRNVLSVVPVEERAAVAVADSRLLARVSGTLAREPSLADSELGVHAVSDGIAILAGHAASPEAHRRAVAIAEDVKGVRSVTSEIRSSDRAVDAEIWERTGPAADTAPRSAFAQALSDRWIETRLWVRLAADPGLSPMAIDVDTREGIVTLFGIVDDPEARARAESRVLAVNGVLMIDNQLQVVPPSAAKAVQAVDADLEAEIEERLDAEPLEDADISVAVRNATVRLTGSVATQEDRVFALFAAGRTRGVRAVSDGLEVRTRSRS